MDVNIRCIYNQSCLLGEGPIWHPIEKVLYWVDIIKPELHRLNLNNHEHQSWIMPTDIGCVAPNKNGGLIAALKNGIALLNPVSNKINYLATLSDKISQISMFNDGHCDRQGRFWIGCKDLSESNPTADIFQFTLKNKLIKKADHFIVANALIASLDSKFFYIADSPKRIIYRYDFDCAAGEIHNPIIFAKVT